MREDEWNGHVADQVPGCEEGDAGTTDQYADPIYDRTLTLLSVTLIMHVTTTILAHVV